MTYECALESMRHSWSNDGSHVKIRPIPTIFGLFEKKVYAHLGILVPYGSEISIENPSKICVIFTWCSKIIIMTGLSCGMILIESALPWAWFRLLEVAGTKAKLWSIQDITDVRTRTTMVQVKLISMKSPMEQILPIRKLIVNDSSQILFISNFQQ